MVKKLLWGIMAMLSVATGLYPVFFFVTERFGILKLKPDALFQNLAWQASFYTHITLGGLALLIGWVQFSSYIRKRFPQFHRNIGKLYVIAVLPGAAAGLYLATHASGGAAAALGFICLSIAWFYATVMGYITIRKGDLLQHGNWMRYSYAASFAAVTLRLWMPFLQQWSGDFTTAYDIVAWLCWLPNMLIAWLLREKRPLVVIHHLAVHHPFPCSSFRQILMLLPLTMPEASAEARQRTV